MEPPFDRPSLPHVPYRSPQGMPPVPQPEPPWWKRILAPFAAVLAVIAKFFGAIKAFLLPAFKWLGALKFAGALKFLPVLLKTGGSMIITIGVYALWWGWKFALGFVLLIFVHELGHVIAARWMKLNVSAPVFIPFVGASILMRHMPPNAWVEAIVGIGGPVAGTVGALACHVIFTQTQQPIWLALAYSAYFLNLFNLIPLTPLDGGRICAALSPWMWILGFFIMIAMIVTRGWISPVMILIMLAALPQVWGLFWSRTPEQQRYYTVTRGQRFTMAVSYVALAGLLFYQMEGAMSTLQELGKWHQW